MATVADDREVDASGDAALVQLVAHKRQGCALSAAVGVARKLAVVMHAMLRSGELFTRTAAAA